LLCGRGGDLRDPRDDPEKLSGRKNWNGKAVENAWALFWRIGMPPMPDLDVWNFYSNYRGRDRP
jgi:hypothetical protein